MNIQESFEDFLKNNSKKGFAKIQVLDSENNLPISNVHVIISKEFKDNTKIFKALVTNEEGLIYNLELPTPDKILSQTPSNIPPYSTYDIFVKCPNYYQDNGVAQLTVFDGITSLQYIKMHPLNKRY